MRGLPNSYFVLVHKVVELHKVDEQAMRGLIVRMWPGLVNRP